MFLFNRHCSEVLTSISTLSNHTPRHAPPHYCPSLRSAFVVSVVVSCPVNKLLKTT